MKIGKKGLIFLAGIIGIVLATIPLLGEDNGVFLKWWLMLLVLGVGFLPLTGRVFGCFEDKGWLFSKAIGIAVSGFAVWALCSAGILKFTAGTSLVITILCVMICWGSCIFLTVRRKEKFLQKEWNLELVLGEEFLFLAVFFIWTYLAGFHPEAHGTEKFMDYGFMAAMMRSETLPAPDIWYALKDTNYYYGGQYYAVYLTKVSFSDVADTYNLMRTLVAALLGGMSFSIVYQLVMSVKAIEKKVVQKVSAVFGGILAVGAVVFSGNLHYLVYGVIGKALGWEKGLEYWFPNSTRYIGYNPETNDKCIHEFPSYSFVLGDLHAHVVNTMFVIVMIGLMTAWILKIRKNAVEDMKVNWKRWIADPYVILGGFFIGLFQFTNYWDFVIYFTVLSICIVYVNLYRRYPGRLQTKEGNEKLKGDVSYPNGRLWVMLAVIVLQMAEAFAIGTIVALPFNLKFETMVSGIGVAQNHTMFYQWMILWGLPTVLLLLFTIFLTVEYLGKRAGKDTKGTKQKRGGIVSGLFGEIDVPDMTVFMIGMCALGLVLIPEVIYVRDIYENGNARANTMFKLTYQAYIMFGIVMSYVIVRFLTWKKWMAKIAGSLGLVLLLSTFGYFGNAVHSWFGDVWEVSEYRCLDATRYMEAVFPEDVSAIRWLNENVEGTPVVLEANGDSYSDYERVSAMTGLPTVLGWYVHEWLWRGNTDDLNQRAADIQAIYTSQDSEEVARLLELYDVSYIFIGKCEREKFPEINEMLLQSFGEIVFGNTSDGLNSTYVIKLNRAQ